MAAALGRRVAQPDRAGPGRGGLRRGARRMLTVEDLAFEENRWRSSRSPCPGQLLATAENSPVLVKYAALLAGLLVVLAFGVRPALRRARIRAQARARQGGRGIAGPGAGSARSGR
jgi:hypothetical protein